MAITPITAFGRLSVQYHTYGREHQLRVYVPEFNIDPGVGTFTAVATPLTLDALALDLMNQAKSVCASDSAFAAGTWVGERHTTGNSFVQVVTGTVGTLTASYVAGANLAGPVSQMTGSFRDSAGNKMRVVVMGALYQGPSRFLMADLSGGYLTFASYFLGSIRTISRAANLCNALIDLTFDTNDGETKRFRR
jgi:hypothetical protein